MEETPKLNVLQFVTVPAKVNGYHHFGCENGMSTERRQELRSFWQECINKEHSCGRYDSKRGDHRYWCDDCEYQAGWDSGD